MRACSAFILCFLLTSTVSAQFAFPENEDGVYEDMLTPAYYLLPRGAAFRDTVNTFVHYARDVPFEHPLRPPGGVIPDVSVPVHGRFGAGKGPGNTGAHHPAMDMHVGTHDTDVTLYAAHDGLVRTFRDAPKYRHYLSIMTEIRDSIGHVLGLMVTLYAHIDLDLDAADQLLMDNVMVKRGDIVSRHLYSGTVGGPHLHLEIRYYRPSDNGDEEFYGLTGPAGNPALTAPSAGSWEYGYWDPSTGYGYGNPANHIATSPTAVSNPGPAVSAALSLLESFPNPFSDRTTIRMDLHHHGRLRVTVSDVLGRRAITLLDELRPPGTHDLPFDAAALPRGVYICRAQAGDAMVQRLLLLQ